MLVSDNNKVHNTICPILWDKMLTMGNTDFNKKYSGVLVDCKTCNKDTCDKI